MRLRVALVAFVALTASQAHAMGVTSGPDARQMRGMGVVQGGGWSLACLFASSNLCSDSRVVTTTRSTAVPCQQSDGTWGTAAINTACIAPGGVAGVESYGAVTNYWTNSATPASMLQTGTPVISGNQVTDDNAAGLEGVFSSCSTTTGAHVVACYLRAGTSTNAAFRFNTDGTGGTVCAVSGLTSTSTRHTCSMTLGGSPSFLSSIIYPAESASITGTATGSIFVDHCQCELASTPGRRCDSGGTATTCGADSHDIATTGIPVAAGEIRFRATLSALTGTNFFFDTRNASGLSGFAFFVDSGGAIRGFAADGTTAAGFPTSASGLVTAGSANDYRITWRGTNYTVYLNGTSVMTTASGIALTSHSAFRIGRDRFGSPLNGTISITGIEAP